MPLEEIEQQIIYRHTNLVARDWRRLAYFYITVLGCKWLPPERNLAGKWIDDATGITDAHIRGVHLLLPGFGDGGPTLEIFSYDESTPGSRSPAANRVGIGHLAFGVGNVNAVLEQVLANGGGRLGEVVSTDVEEVGRLVMVYALDPEGNIIELQSWS